MGHKYAKLEPEAKKIEFFEVDNIMHYKDMQKIVNGRIEGVYLNRKLADLGIDAFVDDRGLIKELKPCIAIKSNRHGITAVHHGTILFAGLNEDGDSVPLNDMQIEYIKNNLTTFQELVDLRKEKIVGITLMIEGDC